MLSMSSRTGGRVTIAAYTLLPLPICHLYKKNEYTEISSSACSRLRGREAQYIYRAQKNRRFMSAVFFFFELIDVII